MNLSQFDDNARTFLEKILAILDIEAVVIEEGIDETTTCYRIDCKPDDARMLIGRNGQTLEALQFVVRQMIKSNAIEQNHFIVDVLDYRGRRRRTLEENAKRGAVAVLNGEQERFPLMPMSAYDRRLVHNYLQENFPELESGSEGEGEERHIVISFKGLDGEGGGDSDADGDNDGDDFIADDEKESESEPKSETKRKTEAKTQKLTKSVAALISLANALLISFSTCNLCSAQQSDPASLKDSSKEPLRGAVEHADAANAWMPNERLPLPEWQSKIAPRLKAGVVWGANLLPQEGTEVAWVQIPDWLAGHWHIENARFLPDNSGILPETTNREDDIFGCQRDKNGGYWHMLRSPVSNVTEGDQFYSRFIHYDLHGRKNTAYQFVLDGDNVEVRVSIKSGKIVTVRRRHDIYAWTAVNGGVEANDHVQFIEEGGKARQSGSGTVKAKPAKVAAFERVDVASDGFKARDSFKAYLEKHGLKDIVPVD